MTNHTDEFYRYLAASPRDRDWGLYVLGAGYQPALPDDESPPHRPHPKSHFYEWERGRTLEEYAIVYISDGQGEFESQLTGGVRVSAGDLFFVFPGVWHRYRPMKKVGWKTYWVHFQGEDADRLVARGFLRPEEPVLHLGDHDAVLHTFNRMFDRLRTEPVGFQQMIAADTLEIVAAALGAVRAQQHENRIQAAVRRARATLENNVHSLPVIDDLIAESRLSRVKFFRVFKEHTGMTPYQYHLQLKIRSAGEMLRNSNLTIRQITRELHVESEYHFSRLFKSKTGMSPSQYRKLMESG